MPVKGSRAAVKDNQERNHLKGKKKDKVTPCAHSQPQEVCGEATQAKYA